MSITTTNNKVIALGNGVNTVFGFGFTSRPLAAAGVSVNPSIANFADGEAPVGAIDGVNLQYTLVHNPSPAASLLLWKNGVLQTQNTDYTLTLGNVITYLAGSKLNVGDAHVCSYRY